MDPVVHIATIEPYEAAAMLLNNKSNRPLRKRRVAAMARDIIDGKWMLNGETIIFDTGGNLLDGQHRLTACVAAEKPIVSVIVRGVERDSAATVDQGAKRTFADVLDMSSEMNTTLLAAIVRRAVLWDMGSRSFNSARLVTHSEMVDYLKTHPELRDSSTFAASYRKYVNATPAVLGLTHYMTNRVNQTSADTFMIGWVNGFDLSEGSPIAALRSRLSLLATAGGRARETEQMGYIVHAWNQYRDGAYVMRLQQPKGGWTADNIPDPR